MDDSLSPSLLQLSAVGFTSGPSDFSYTPKEAILYALGVGVSTEDRDGLKYLYEGHPEFSVLPSFGVLPALSSCFEYMQQGVPGIQIDLTRVSEFIYLIVFGIIMSFVLGSPWRTIHGGAGRLHPPVVQSEDDLYDRSGPRQGEGSPHGLHRGLQRRRN